MTSWITGERFLPAILLSVCNIAFLDLTIGRKEGVEKAKKAILQSAERISMRTTVKDVNAKFDSDSPEQEEDKVYDIIKLNVTVPASTVGLVIGNKGCTIKAIQEATNTYIKTPQKNREPIFEVIGQPMAVKMAKDEIMRYIVARCEDGLKLLMKDMPIADTESERRGITSKLPEEGQFTGIRPNPRSMAPMNPPWPMVSQRYSCEVTPMPHPQANCLYQPVPSPIPNQMIGQFRSVSHNVCQHKPGSTTIMIPRSRPMLPSPPIQPTSGGFITRRDDLYSLTVPSPGM